MFLTDTFYLRLSFFVFFSLLLIKKNWIGSKAIDFVYELFWCYLMMIKVLMGLSKLYNNMFIIQSDVYKSCHIFVYCTRPTVIPIFTNCYAYIALHICTVIGWNYFIWSVNINCSAVNHIILPSSINLKNAHNP